MQRAKHIKNKAKANEAIKMDAQSLHIEVLRLRSQIEKMKKEGFAAAGIEMGGEPDPEVLEKLQREEERCQELENQLMDVRNEHETAQSENVKLENEISVLRNLKSELQKNINEMMDQFNAWQQKIGEAEEITKRVRQLSLEGMIICFRCLKLSVKRLWMRLRSIRNVFLIKKARSKREMPRLES